MNLDIIATFLELGHATSQNLEFVHRRNVRVSYGEETITETNLLEIRRRHPGHVRLHTFQKRVEAKTGADWEWRVVGRQRTLKMRVQAKRLRWDGFLKVKHRVGSSGPQQRDLLVAGARAAGMKAVYCIYCTERQRKVWNQSQAPSGCRSFETGCLLADAAHVPLTARALGEFEEKCRPWHHLFLPPSVRQAGLDFFAVDQDDLWPVPIGQPHAWAFRVGRATKPPKAPPWNPPTVDDLNEDTGREFDECGVARTTDEDRARLEKGTETEEGQARLDDERLQELGIARMMVIDVRGEPVPREPRDRRRD